MSSETEYEAFEPYPSCKNPVLCRRDGFCDDAWRCSLDHPAKPPHRATDRVSMTRNIFTDPAAIARSHAVMALVDAEIEAAGDDGAAGPGAAALTDELIDRHLNTVLRAAGSALKYYDSAKNIAALRAAMRAVLAASHPSAAKGMRAGREQG